MSGMKVDVRWRLMSWDDEDVVKIVAERKRASWYASSMSCSMVNASRKICDTDTNYTSSQLCVRSCGI